MFGFERGSVRLGVPVQVSTQVFESISSRRYSSTNIRLRRLVFRITMSRGRNSARMCPWTFLGRGKTV